MSTKPNLDAGTGSRHQTGPHFFQRRYMALMVLVSGLSLTVGATLHIESTVNKDAELQFRASSDNIQRIISDRLDDHARILLSCAALFSSSDRVTREEWRAFTRILKIDKELPGIQVLGFSQLIPRAELPRHIQEIRREGFPDYTLKPDGEREWYSAIIYLEPFSAGNLRASGYDMLSEPLLRSAMELARDTGAAALSGQVVLTRETATEAHSGSVMYVPVYRTGMPTATPEQRRAAIYGWVFSPCRMSELLEGVLHDGFPDQTKQLHLQVCAAGVQPLPQQPLYECQHPGGQIISGASRFTRQIPVDFNGHRWTLLFRQVGSGYFSFEYMSVWLTLAGGSSASLLLFALIRNLHGTRAEARRLAEELTLALRVEHQRLANILDGTRAGTWEWNIQTGEALCNEQWAAIIGYSLDEISPVSIKTWLECAHHDDVLKSRALLDEHFSGKSQYYETEARMKHKDGYWVWVLARGKVASWSDDGKPLWMFGTHQEITAKKEAELFLAHAREKLEIEVLVRTAALGQANEEIKKVSFALVMAEEKERERIAGELHDQVGQSLLLAKMKLDELAYELPSDELYTTAAQAAALIGTSIQDIRSLTFKMRPLQLESPDIEKNLQWLCASINEDYGAAIHFTGTATVIPLAVELRGTLYRVVRELLLNVIKHAKTKRAALTLQADDSHLTLCVSDQGVGFSPSGAVSKHSADGGYGLYNVRQRIEWFGGTLTVESAYATGTVVTVVVPLQ